MVVLEVVFVIFKEIALSLFSYLSQSIIFAILMVVATVYFYEHGFKSGITKVWGMVKSSSHYRYLAAFYLYIYLMALQTIISREAEWCGWCYIMNDWWFYYSNGELNCNWLLNYLLFVPYGYLLLGTFEKLVKQASLKKVIKVSLKFSFLTSLGIEVIQLLFSVGTFQLADLCYNTLGGLSGAVLYWFLKSRKSQA